MSGRVFESAATVIAGTPATHYKNAAKEGAVQLPLQRDAKSSLSLQAQIFNQVRQLILDGRLKPGTRMPASRALAMDLDVSRNTIILVYERLMAEGYLEPRQPVGTFVSSAIVHETPTNCPLPARSPQKSIDDRRRARLFFKGQAHVIVSPYDTPVQYDFWVGRPDARLFPIKDWMQIMRRRLRDVQYGNSAYAPPAGLPALRQAIADHVGVARGIRTSPAQVIVVNGTQEALTILAQMFIRAGTAVAIENPCYLGAANVFASHGARLHPTDTDADGLVIDKLPDDAALVYLTPSHQYPTGAMLTAERRVQLLEWSTAHSSYVLEDDYNSDFCYDHAPLPALKSLDDCDQVIYLGTFSKSLGAGLRAGYMIVPEHLVEVARMAKGLLNNCSGWAVQALLADFLSSGQYHHHLRRIRTIYAARRDCLINGLTQTLGGGQVGGAQSGMHITWRLPDNWPLATDLEQKARRVDVGIYSLPTGNSHVSGLQAQSHYARTIMLGYAALDEAEITEGIRRLGALMH